MRERARHLHSRLGPVSRDEILALVIVLATVVAMMARSFVPALEPLDKSAIILVSTILFFLFRILTVEDLEQIPWNIVLLFGGAMSIGLCMWQTGAASWMAVHWLALFEGAPWFVFVMGVALFVLVMTNVIMNVAAIAICLPVALVIAGYLGVAPEVILYVSLVDRRHALPAPGRGGPQRHRLRERPVHVRGVLQGRGPGEHPPDGRPGPVRLADLAPHGHARPGRVGSSAGGLLGEVDDAEALGDVGVVDPVGVQAPAGVLGQRLSVDPQGLEA